MALFSKLNNVMSTKRVANQPLLEENRAALEEAIIFGGKTKMIQEEIQGVKLVSKADALEESLISDPNYCKRLVEELTMIKEATV